MLKKKKNLAVICVALSTACLFSGCSSVGLNDAELLSPPKATGEKAEIQKVIDNTVGSDYTLQYPKTGDYHSAVIAEDLNGNGNDEVMVMYRTNNDASTTNLLFVDKTTDGWHAVKSYTNKNFDIDSVYISDVDNDGLKEIIVAWSSFIGETNQMTYYKFMPDDVVQYTVDATYSDIAIGDLTGDGTDDMLLLSPATQQNKTAMARLYTFSFENNTQKINMVGEVYTNPNVTKYSNVNIGMASDNTAALFLDGATSSNQTLSEVIYFDKATSTLVDPLNTTSNLNITSNITTRTTASVCRDIDNDGIMEIPKEAVMQGAAPPDTTETLCSLNEWLKINETTKETSTVAYTVASYADGYYFVIPSKWENNVAVTNDTATRTMRVYALDKPTAPTTEQPTNPKETTTQNAESTTNESVQPATEGQSSVAQTAGLIMTIQVFTEKDWNAGTNINGYIESIRANGYVYAIKLESNLADEYTLTEDDVKNNIKIV